MLKVCNEKKDKAHKSYENDVSNIRYAKSYLDELIIAIDRETCMDKRSIGRVR